MEEGFWKIAPTKPQGRPRTCVACGRYKFVLSPKMLPYGKCKKGILNIGEGPGETEDRRNKQWQGKIGMALQSAYQEFGYDLFEDCGNINAMNCRPTNSKGANREPSSMEIACCRSRVLQAIEEYKPKVIMLFGEHAVNSVIGHRWKKDLKSISRWRGWTIPDREYEAWLCPQFHPGYPERGDTEVRTVWMDDLERALSKSKVPFPDFEDEAKQVEIITDLSVLDKIDKPFAFDFETTGLKPHDTSQHQIICASVAYRKNHAYSFMFPEVGSKNMKHLKRLLRSDLKKIASNMKFEDTWTYNIMGIRIKNWWWDTMLAAHVLDNRPSITSLKFLAYVYLGVVDYDSEIAPYFASDKKNANSVNQIKKLTATSVGRRKLLTYCGLDSIYERRIAFIQRKEIQ